MNALFPNDAIDAPLRLWATERGGYEQRWPVLISADTLHRAGWVEADGRLLRQQDFPELYAQVGRAYTRTKTANDLFAVPNLTDRRNDPNPYGVLGPGDLITSGSPVPLPPPPSYFIYVGRDAQSVEARWK